MTDPPSTTDVPRLLRSGLEWTDSDLSALADHIDQHFDDLRHRITTLTNALETIVGKAELGTRWGLATRISDIATAALNPEDTDE